MQIEYFMKNDVFVIAVEGDIDHLSAANVKSCVSYGLSRYRAKKFIIDLKKVYFMDSSGIGMLIGRYKEMMFIGGEMVLCGVNQNINKLLGLSGLYKIIKSFENINTAMEYFLEVK